MKFAVIKTGGKQYRVKRGDALKIEKLPEEVGETVTFKEVLLVADGKKVSVGTPTVKGASVSAKVIAQEKHPKQIVYKMRPKKRYRVKKGHRQSYTEVKILKVDAK